MALSFGACGVRPGEPRKGAMRQDLVRERLAGLGSRTHRNALEDVADAADGGLAQDELEQDAGATDDQRQDDDREVLEQDA